MNNQTLELIVTNPESPEKMKLIRQPYAATIARHRLDIHQMRILTRIMERLQPQMKYKTEIEEIEVEKENRVFKFEVKELLPVGNSNHSLLRKSLKELTKKDISFTKKCGNKKGGVEINTHLVQRTEFKKWANSVEIEIDRDVLPLLIALSTNYTKYSAKISFQSSSSSIMRVYQYISQYRDLHHLKVKGQKLKEILGITEKYNCIHNLKKRIILPAQKELKIKGDVWFEIQKNIMEGRRVVGWEFSIHTKSEKKLGPRLPLAYKKGKKKEEVNNKIEITLIQELKLSEKQAKNLLKNAPKKELLKAMYDIRLLYKNGKIKNIGGYCCKVLGEKFNIKL